MRNKKLFDLTEKSKNAHDELTQYLRHLDERETEPNYVHARMLFGEGWRYQFNTTIFQATFNNPGRSWHRLWMSPSGEDYTEGSSTVEIEVGNCNDPAILNALQLSVNPSSDEILNFLIELTEEVDPSNIEAGRNNPFFN